MEAMFVLGVAHVEGNYAAHLLSPHLSYEVSEMPPSFDNLKNILQLNRRSIFLDRVSPPLSIAGYLL